MGVYCCTPLAQLLDAIGGPKCVEVLSGHLSFLLVGQFEDDLLVSRATGARGTAHTATDSMERRERVCRPYSRLLLALGIPQAPGVRAAPGVRIRVLHLVRGVVRIVAPAHALLVGGCDSQDLDVSDHDTLPPQCR